MKEVSEFIVQHLSEGNLMQLATIEQGKPWICTVYYVVDDQQRLYWLSLPTRRHSQDLAEDQHAAIAIAIKSDQPVIGVQAEGVVSVVSDTNKAKDIMEIYTAKYNAGQKFYDNFIAGQNEHVLYQFTPSSFVLFDEVNFKDNARQEWRPQA